METSIESISVPPGFRFHPTEEELVGYYLNRRVNSLKIDLNVIVDLDLYRIEPWDIQERCRLGYEEQSEWYFFSHKDRKYPTGTRTNRATTAGFWKATGRDKAVLSKERMIGMRKTLVFYRGRAPNGRKTDWIMHEYRLQTSHHAPTQEEGWVVCRAFKKPSPSCHPKQHFESAYWSNSNNSVNYYNNYRLPSSSNAADLSSPCSSMQTIHAIDHQTAASNSNFQQFSYNTNNNFDQNYSMLELPQLDDHHHTGDYDDEQLIINSQNQGISHLLGCLSDDLL